LSDDPSIPISGKLSPEETEVLLYYLADGVSDRVRLPEIFRALADDMCDSRLQQVAQRLTDRLENGDDLADAFKSVQHVIPGHLQQALVVGEESGNLPGVLRGLSESELARREMRRGLWSVLTYPLLVLGLLTLLLIYLAVFLRPMFVAIYDDFELDLPYITVFYLGFLQAVPWTVLIFFLLIVSVLAMLVLDSRIVHWFATCVPLIGRALIWRSQHEFASMMATLTAESVPIDEALDCTAKSLRDRNIARATRIAQQKCASGKSLGQALSESIHFDRTLSSLVAWGEEQDTLPIALREAANTYLAQMALYIHFLERIVPPVMLIVVAMILFFSVAAFLLPLMTLINGLTG
jgi:type IV pilus assembly protein PilC